MTSSSFVVDQQFINVRRKEMSSAALLPLKGLRDAFYRSNPRCVAIMLSLCVLVRPSAIANIAQLLHESSMLHLGLVRP